MDKGTKVRWIPSNRFQSDLGASIDESGVSEAEFDCKYQRLDKALNQPAHDRNEVWDPEYWVDACQLDDVSRIPGIVVRGPKEFSQEFWAALTAVWQEDQTWTFRVQVNDDFEVALTPRGVLATGDRIRDCPTVGSILDRMLEMVAPT